MMDPAEDGTVNTEQSAAPEEGAPVATFGPCTRCGEPIHWHNALFLCTACLADHFALRYLYRITVEGTGYDLAIAKKTKQPDKKTWAEYTVSIGFVFLQVDPPDVTHVIFQASHPIGDGFCYAEIRLYDGDQRAQCIQLVNVDDTNRTAAIQLATLGFDLFGLEYPTRGRPFDHALKIAAKRQKTREAMALKERYALSWEEVSERQNIPLSTLKRYRKNFG